MNVSELSGTALPDGVADHLREQGIEELYPPQAEAVEAGVLDGENLVASVPTASGKTLIATLAMLSTVERGGTALYIVPLRALASEKAAEFEELERFGCSVGVSTGNYESDGDWLRQCDVVVATSEKVDSLLRNDAAWIEDVRCVVSDEVHLVDDPNRGPTLEVTLAKLRRTTPELQVVALSATVGNADALADWLDAELVDTDWRPVELNTGVHRDGRISFADGATAEVPVERGERQEAALVRDALGEAGSSLVFVNSRKNAEAAAKRLSGVVDPHLDADTRAALEERAAEIRDASDTATSESLAAAVERGAAFHHAGLSRDSRAAVEDAFREREIKAVCATPTLAAGVNTPSRRVIVRDWRRYDSTAGGMAPLDTLEVHQMFGRAGRPGRDPVGEAVLLASNADEESELFDRYVYADPEPVRSKLAAEPALRTHVLATVATGFASDRAELLAFLDGTLYAHQTTEPGRLADVVDAVCEYLAANEFLEIDRAGPEGSDALRATATGHLVSQLYVDPMSAATIIDGLRAAGDGGPAADAADADSDGDEPSALGLYQLVSRTPDMYQLYLRSGDRETYTEIFYEREAELLGPAPSEFADAEFEEYLSALKTGRLLEDWADEVDEDRIAERYGVGPGDVRGKVETASWLLGAAERLAGDLELGCAPAVRAARKRVEDGVREELLDLTSVRNVGRVRARSLFEAGIEDRTDLRESDPAVALRALEGRRKTTETILENAGHPDPDLEGVSVEDAPAGGATGANASAGDGPSAAAGDGAGADGRETTDQTGLGDF